MRRVDTRPRLTLVIALAAAACGDETDRSPSPDPREATPPAALGVEPPPAVLPATGSIYAGYLPTKLCSMEREDIQPITEALVAARYERDDVTMHVNIGEVTDLPAARGLYEHGYQRRSGGAWGVYTRSWTLADGEENKEACIIVRSFVNVCVDVLAKREPPDPVPCLLEMDLPGLVELAAARGASTGLADLDFTYTEAQWQAHEASLRPGWAEYERACTLHAAGEHEQAAAALVKAGRGDQPIALECRMLEETRGDCERDAFDERLAETDIHLTPHERESFRRSWEITCALAGKPRRHP